MNVEHLTKEDYEYYYWKYMNEYYDEYYFHLQLVSHR